MLKKKVATQPILQLPIFEKLFIIECDTSGLAVGWVLNQESRQVSFYSERPNEAKKKYSYYDPEIHAPIQSPRKWRHYLLPKEFFVFTDKQALNYIKIQENLGNRNLKWMEYLQDFTFTIKHKKGQMNKVVDALRKRLLTIQEVQLHSIGIESFKSLYKKNEDFAEAYKVCFDFENHFHRMFSEFALQNGLLFKGNQLCVPRGSIRENLI